MENTFKAWFLSFVHLFFPRQCAVCGSSLQEGEEGICIRCNMNMPRTNYHLREDNSVERMFWGKIPLERGTSFFYYHKGSDFRHILHQLKYGGRKDLGEIMGRFMAAELAATGFFRGIDVIIPVPLHPRKQKLRGYNQSECIARGVSAVTGIPIVLRAAQKTYGNADPKVCLRALGKCRRYFPSPLSGTLCGETYPYCG